MQTRVSWPCMAAMEEEDPEQVRAALILASLQYRKLRRPPEWVQMKPSGEASSSSPGTVAVAANVMPSGEAASSSSAAGTVAADTGVPLRRRTERVSMHSGVASLAGATVAAGWPKAWPTAKRSGLRGETSKEKELEQGHAAAAASAVTKGSGAPRSSEQERYAEMPAASSAQRPVVAALCYAAEVAVAGSGPSSTGAAAPAKEPMKTPSPNTPLDYGAGGSGAPSSADDAAPARPQAKREGTGARGSVGGGDGNDEGCSSPPAKRGRVAEEEKPTPISVEPIVQSETRASSGKGAPRPFDLNLLPCALDEDDDGSPDTT